MAKDNMISGRLPYWLSKVSHNFANLPTSCEKLSIKNVDTNVAIDVDNEVKSVCSASTNTEPSDFIDYDELSYKVVQELEQWKSYQMQKFLLELARKENVYKEQFEFKTAQVMATLERKISTCDQLNGQLDRMIRDFGASTHKTQEQLQLFETMKRDMENNYEKKFMEIGDQMESLKSDILKKDKVTDCNNIKEIKEENASLKGETIRLKDRIGVLQQHLTIAQNGNVPINQLINIISDLGKQSERLKAAEKSSHYYQEQWTDVSHEINKIKFELIKMQEQKSTVKDLDSTDLCLFLHGIISDEQDALTSERSELESIRNVLFKEISMEKE